MPYVEIADKESEYNHQNLTPLSQSVHIHFARKGTLAARETERGDFSCGMDDLGRWVKLYEKLMKSAVYKDTHAKNLLIHLLLKAQWQSNTYKTIFKMSEITLSAGQIVTGRYKLARELGESPSTLRNALKRLKELYQIVDYTSDSKRTIVTILKWDTYQSKEIEKDSTKDSGRTAGGQREDTNQEYKKDRRTENKKNPPSAGLFQSQINEKKKKAQALIASVADKVVNPKSPYKVDLKAIEVRYGKQVLSTGAKYKMHHELVGAFKSRGWDTSLIPSVMQSCAAKIDNNGIKPKELYPYFEKMICRYINENAELLSAQSKRLNLA